MKHFSIRILIVLETRDVVGTLPVPTHSSHTTLLIGWRDPNAADCPGAWERDAAVSTRVMAASSRFLYYRNEDQLVTKDIYP